MTNRDWYIDKQLFEYGKYGDLKKKQIKDVVEHKEEYEEMVEITEQRWIEQKARDVRKYGFVTTDEEHFKKNYQTHIQKHMQLEY